MKYSLTKTYYAIIEGEVKEVKFVRRNEYLNLDMFSEKTSIVIDVFSYKTNDLNHEIELNKQNIFTDYASAYHINKLKKEKLPAIDNDVKTSNGYMMKMNKEIDDMFYGVSGGDSEEPKSFLSRLFGNK